MTQGKRIQDVADICGLSYSALQKVKGKGAPIDDLPALLKWWQENRRTKPPEALVIAAAKADQGQAADEPEDDEPPIEALDIEQAVEAQRQNFAIIQRELRKAQKSGSHTLIEMWQGRIDKSALSLARLEKIAKEVREADKRWLPLEAFREAWNEVHTNLNERLYAVAADPDRSTLRARWDAAVAKLLENPFA